jgi:integrase
LYELESHYFTTDRLNVVRDVFVFQCYTGLAYIDAYQLKKTDIKEGIDGNLWIMSERQKTNSSFNVPLLPQALKIVEKYKEHPLCIQRGTVLPVSSNQKMNEYLKEVAVLCGFPFTLNTHMARRTFGSTVTLNNNVPINVVKELLGHASVKQTEAYTITEQATIGREMSILNKKLNKTGFKMSKPDLAVLSRLEKEIQAIKKKYNISS